jgi:acylphosphatase
VWAQGSADDVEAMVAFLRVGPPAARVDSLVAVPGTPNPEITSFAVRY